MNEKQNGTEFAKGAVTYGVVALLCVVIMWLLPPDTNIKVALVILGVGIVFDLMSLFYHLMTLITGKFMSGFPVVGLFFYGFFLLTSQFSMVGWDETSLAHIMLYKIVDALILLAFHVSCQFPMKFQKSRENYE